MTTNHTPGQWHQNGNVVWSDACKDRGNVAECCLITGTHVPVKQNAVNARLIAAAPDLLAALKRVRQAFYVDGKASALRAAFEGTKELVARAEGRAD